MLTSMASTAGIDTFSQMATNSSAVSAETLATRGGVKRRYWGMTSLTK